MILAKENLRIHVRQNLDHGQSDYEGLPVTSWYVNASIPNNLDDEAFLLASPSRHVQMDRKEMKLAHREASWAGVSQMEDCWY